MTVTLADAAITANQRLRSAEEHGIALRIINCPDTTHESVLLPRSWIVERHLGWLRRTHRFVHDHEQLPTSCRAFFSLDHAHGKHVLPSSDVLRCARQALTIELVPTREHDRRSGEERPKLGAVPFHDLTRCMGLMRLSIRVVLDGEEAVFIMLVVDEAIGGL